MNRGPNASEGLLAAPGSRRPSYTEVPLLASEQGQTELVSVDFGVQAAIWDSSPAWLAYYFLANLGLTLYNKLLMDRFPFPWALTGIHALCGALGAFVCYRYKMYELQQLSLQENLVLVAFSTLYTVNIAVSNISLGLVTVPVGRQAI